MKKERLYVDRINGQWEAYTYSDGNRVYVMVSGFFYLIEMYAKKHGYLLLKLASLKTT